MRKTDPKTTMLAHSEAKVEFYSKYLVRYIRIIGLSRQFSEINIFDVFCGTGVYDNGKKGSPIAAYDVIKEFREEYPEVSTSINLYVNDSASEKVDEVKSYIDAANNGDCAVHYTTNDAEDSFRNIQVLIDKQDGGSRNLIFIDPYGYKNIDRNSLGKLLNNRRTEVILFLPISHMQRFTAKAVDSEEAPYIPLKNFVSSFFSTDHPIHKGTLSLDQYIDAVQESLEFGRLHSASFVIERDASNRYALFFISSHIYGFEKILEVKWQMDEDEGRGFSQPEVNPTFSFFQEEEKRLAQEQNYSQLEVLLLDFLQNSKTNQEMYAHILKLQFLPRHANQILRRWQESNELEVIDVQAQKPARKGSFYLSWENYKQSSPRVKFILKKW
jgi:three-Cys-motif partner protein